MTEGPSGGDATFSLRMRCGNISAGVEMQMPERKPETFVKKTFFRFLVDLNQKQTYKISKHNFTTKSLRCTVLVFFQEDNSDTVIGSDNVMTP